MSSPRLDVLLPYDRGLVVYLPEDVRAARVIADLSRSLRRLKTLSVEREKTRAGLVGYGWWAYAIRTARSITVLYREGYEHEASALRRTLLHHTAALAWLAKDPDAALNALTFEHQNRRQRLGANAKRRGWDLQTIRLPKKPRGPRPPSVDLLDSVEKLCDAVGWFESGYPIFLLESSFVHPSLLGADEYFDQQGRGPRAEPNGASYVPLSSVARLAIEATKAVGAVTEDAQFAALSTRAEARL